MRTERTRGGPAPAGAASRTSGLVVMEITGDPAALATFWAHARRHIDDAPLGIPEAWAFGATSEHADELLDLVISGTKTGTATSLWDLEATGEAIPRVGDLSIILDGAGEPRAVIRTCAVAAIPFDRLPEEHAFSEGEGDRSLDAWREIHERFWSSHSENERGYSPDMPVLCERFEVLHVAPGPGRAKGVPHRTDHSPVDATAL